MRIQIRDAHPTFVSLNLLHGCIFLDSLVKSHHQLFPHLNKISHSINRISHTLFDAIDRQTCKQIGLLALSSVYIVWRSYSHFSRERCHTAPNHFFIMWHSQTIALRFTTLCLIWSFLSPQDAINASPVPMQPLLKTGTETMQSAGSMAIDGGIVGNIANEGSQGVHYCKLMRG